MAAPSDRQRRHIDPAPFLPALQRRLDERGSSFQAMLDQTRERLAESYMADPKLKLADIVINMTAGGPGGATDTVTSFIFREYRERSNVGYGTMLAFVYLVLIILFVTGLLKLASRWNTSGHD